MILKFLLFQLLGSLWGRQCFFPWADLVSARLWGMVTADASQREKAASPTPVLSVPRTRDAGLLGWRRLLGVGSSFPLQGGGHPPGDHPPGVSCELCFTACARLPACSVVSDSATPWTGARQAPLSLGFSLEWVAISSSKESSRPRGQTCVLHCRWILSH